MKEAAIREELLNIYMLEDQINTRIRQLHDQLGQIRERKRRVLEALALLEEQKQGTFAKPQVIQGGTEENVEQGNGGGGAA